MLALSMTALVRNHSRVLLHDVAFDKLLTLFILLLTKCLPWFYGLQGALQHMGEPEVQHWMRMASCRSLATGAESLQGLLQSHGQKANCQKASFEVKAWRNILYIRIFGFFTSNDPR